MDSGILRQMASQIFPHVYTPEIIVLIGSRRSGKGTILYQIMDALEKERISQQKMLYLNFEEPKLIPSLNLKGLHAIYDSYREDVFPEGKAFLFLDEILNIQE